MTPRTAVRVSARAARAAFEAGSSVVVSTTNAPALPVSVSTVTHNRTTTSWKALSADIALWAHREGRTYFYVLPAGLAAQIEGDRRQAAAREALATLNAVLPVSTGRDYRPREQDMAAVVSAARVLADLVSSWLPADSTSTQA